MPDKNKNATRTDITPISYGQLAILIAVFIAAISLRLYFAWQIVNPGHGDPAYYMSLAKNLASGQGFVIDYIWHFLTPWQSLTHYANDFWMPLTSVIISTFLILFGKSLLVALLPSMIFGAGLALVTYFWALHYTNSSRIASWSTVLCLFAPVLFKYSLITDSSIYYAFFAAIIFLLIAKTDRQPWLMMAASIFAGLAQLCRQDGVLLMLTLLIMIYFMPYERHLKLKIFFGSLILYLATLSPYFITNIIYTGRLFLSQTYVIAFVRSHDDIYSWGKDLSLGSYLHWGLANIVSSKLHAIVDNSVAVFRSFGREFIIIPILGLANLIFLRPFKTRPYYAWPPFVFFILVFLFYAFIATFPAQGGALFRTAMAIVPFAIILAVEFVIRYLNHKYISNSILLLILVAAIFGSVRFCSILAVSDRQMQNDLSDIGRIIRTEGNNNQEPIIMTRDPWEVNYTTGLRAVMIPNNDLNTIYYVAIKYHANYLLLPAPRKALQKIYDGQKSDPRFEFWRDIPNSDYRLFKIVTIGKS